MCATTYCSTHTALTCAVWVLQCTQAVCVLQRTWDVCVLQRTWALVKSDISCSEKVRKNSNKRQQLTWNCSDCSGKLREEGGEGGEGEEGGGEEGEGGE